eukprot:11189938-Lingulodinium_polyedra.AAC.1
MGAATAPPATEPATLRTWQTAANKASRAAARTPRRGRCRPLANTRQTGTQARARPPLAPGRPSLRGAIPTPIP